MSLFLFYSDSVVSLSLKNNFVSLESDGDDIDLELRSLSLQALNDPGDTDDQVTEDECGNSTDEDGRSIHHRSIRYYEPCFFSIRIRFI